MSAIKTFRDLIEAKGVEAISKALNLADPGPVRVMKFRNYISRDHWPELQLAFEDVSLKLLLKLERAAKAAA